jgi:ESS family glutamate:Na+ symporter
VGGPIAKFLIHRHKLEPVSAGPLDVGVSNENEQRGIDHLDFLDAILAIHISIILGALLNKA